MKAIARFFSIVFSPFFIPTYGVYIGLFCTLMALAPIAARIYVTLIICGITCIVPALAIYFLHKLNFVTDWNISKQRERFIPYIIAVLSYLAAAFCLYRANAPLWLRLYMIGGVVAVVILIIINQWWKISAHMTAIGGLMALCFRILNLNIATSGLCMSWVTLSVIMIAGILGSSRLYLGRHSLGQVLAGTACGFLCVYFITAIH